MDAYVGVPEARGRDASKEPISAGWLPLAPIISSELSEALGNQGSGTRIQYRDSETDNRNALAEYLGSRLAFTSQAPQTELQDLVYSPSPLFDAEQVEHYSIDRPNFSAIDISNLKNSTLHQQVGFSSPSLFGSACSSRPSAEISPVSTTALSSGKLETLSTREETCLNEPFHAKRLRNGETMGKVLPSTGCPPMSRQGVPSTTPVSGSQTGNCVIQIHPEDAAVLSEPRGRVRARRGQATDPHSISERNRRVKISERLKTLQGLVPDANKTDKASMLDEIISHVELLQLQIFTMSKIGGGSTGVITPLLRDFYLEGTQNVGGANFNENGMGTSCSQSDLDLVEKRVVQLLREDINAAAEYLESKGLCLIPISKVRKLSSTVTDSQVTSEAIKDSFGTSVRKRK